MERLWKPNVGISPACPRCGSSNTKFCYYNNYSLTQPRYFCKGCRRYWTRGGSLRNVPMGGGCRKTRRGKSIRVSTDRVPNSRTLAHGTTIALGESGAPTSSSVVHGGPNIDLALVYNNFLNQNPESERVELPELPVLPNVDIEFGNMEEMSMQFSTHIPLENGGTFVECPNLSERSPEAHLSDLNAIYNCGFELTHNNQQESTIQELTCNHTMIDYSLPPLPGEEEASQEMNWSNPQILGTDHMLHSTQMPPGVEPNLQVQDQFIGDKGNFDMSSYGIFFQP